MNESENINLSMIAGSVRDCIDGVIHVNDLVCIFDDFVSRNGTKGFSAEISDLIDQFHLSLALFVPDEQTRKEEPGVYLDKNEILQKSVEFLALLESLNNSLRK